MENDISIGIVDEARNETKTEEPSFLCYQRDLYRPEPTWVVAVNSKRPYSSGGLLQCSMQKVDVIPRNSFCWGLA